MPKEFKRSDKFIGCNEALETLFVPANGSFFRVVHNPLEKNDELVQSEQMFEGLAPSLQIPETIEAGSNIDEQYEHIKDWSLSYNVDEEQLAALYWGGYDKRQTDSQKANYVRRKGDSIAKYNLVPETGLIQKEIDPNGHTVHVEYEDFVMENYRDKDYGFKPLIQYRHEDK